jgi:ribosomal protein S18 acetylase RimI-like enzyme
MEPFRRLDDRTQVGLVALEVAPALRRQGYGRYLVSEILRHGREHSVDVVAVQTSATNAAARALYGAVGFVPVGTSTLYRLPG